jgi:intein/homing endonuclease
MADDIKKPGDLERNMKEGSVLKDLIRIFRTNTVVKHHFQSTGNPSPQGVAKIFFKNAYSFRNSVIPGYSSYDRFARMSDYAEMESFAILSNALNIVSDEVTQKNEKGKTLEITSENEKIKICLTELFEEVLKLNGKNLWKTVRNVLKYGDCFYLLDITEENGIINLIRMPANEVERDEGFDKDDPSAIRFRWTAKQNIEIPNAFVVHFRLEGNDLFMPYGQSFLEAARRPWRQLCCAATQLVWTDSGYKQIKDITSNDYVYCHDYENNVTKKTKVVACKPMGKQRLITLKTRNRSITVTPNHGLLFKDGNGNFSYKKAEDAVVNKRHMSDKLVLPVKSGGPAKFEVESNFSDFMVELKERVEYNSVGVMNEIRSLNLDYSDKNIHAFLNAQHRIPYSDYLKLSSKFKIDKSNICLKWKGSKKDTITNDGIFVVDKDFCRLFGFLLGDGWIAKDENSCGFATGIRQEENEYYKNLLEKYSQSKSFEEQPGNFRGGQINISSQEFCDLLTKLEFKTGAKNKIVPSWIFKMNEECRLEFIKGYLDADGYENKKEKDSSKTTWTASSISKDLLDGIRLLSQQTGVKVSKEVKSDRPEGFYFDKSFNKQIYRQASFKLNINLDTVCRDTSYENVTQIEDAGEGETYDLQVEDDLHNFVIEGIVSHNTLLEDAMMAYRISRAPERRVFFLDIGGIPADTIEPTINKFNESIKKKHVVDANGRIDLRNGAALSIDEDYVIPVRGGDTATRIETLPGGTNLGDIEDVEYIRANLFAALGIPKAFLTFDQDIRSKQVLTQEDIRFARTVARIQEVIISELIKIAMIHLYIKGFRGQDLVNFKIKMTNPSTVAELQKMELWRSRMDLVMSAKEGVFDTTFIYKEFLQLSENQIDTIRKGQIQDKIFQAKLLQLENSQGLMPGQGTELGMMGGGTGMGGMGGGMPPMGGDTGMGGLGGAGGLPPGDMGAGGLAPSSAEPAPDLGGGVAGESKGMKDLFRDSSGDSRKKERRGLDGLDVTKAGDSDDDPNDLAGIRRTVSSPMGGRETVDIGIKDFKKLFESYGREEFKSTPPSGMSEEYLKKIFSEHVSKNTKQVLHEKHVESQKILHEKLELDLFEEQLQKIEEDSKELLNEVYNRNK